MEQQPADLHSDDRWATSSIWFRELFRAQTVVSLAATGGMIGTWFERDHNVPSAQAIGIILGCLTGSVLGGTPGRICVWVVHEMEQRRSNIPAQALIAGSIGGTTTDPRRPAA